jgi:hypothetical protein
MSGSLSPSAPSPHPAALPLTQGHGYSSDAQQSCEDHPPQLQAFPVWGGREGVESAESELTGAVASLSLIHSQDIYRSVHGMCL